MELLLLFQKKWLKESLLLLAFIIYQGVRGLQKKIKEGSNFLDNSYLVVDFDWYWQISIVIVLLLLLEKSYAQPAILDIKVCKLELKYFSILRKNIRK